MITIYINDKAKEVPKNTTVFQLLDLIKSPIKGIAVAIGNSVIASTDWEEKELHQNDRLLLIQATQGG